MRVGYEDFVDRDRQQENQLRRALRHRVLKCVMQAVAKLAREARGVQTIERETELRACVALARLAPVLLGAAAQREATANEEPFRPRIHPNCPIEVADRLIAEAEERDRIREQERLTSAQQSLQQRRAS
jgi:hypothetical protein